MPAAPPFFAHPRHAPLWRHVAAAMPAGDPSHDLDHVARVYQVVLRLAPEAGADPDLAGAAALVHDLAEVPKESPERPLGSERSAEAARGPLAEAGYTAEEVARIHEAVRTASWSRGLAATTPEGLALQEADRLDAIGAIGVARNFACAAAMAGRGAAVRLFHPADPAALTDRPLDDVRHAADHHRVKLLRIAATLRLPTARAEAARRHAFLEAFLAELAREVAFVAGEAG